MGSEASKEKNSKRSPEPRRSSDGNSNNGPTASLSNSVGGSNKNIGLPPAIKVGSSVSWNDNLNAGIPQQTDSKLSISNDQARSRSGSASSNKQNKKPTIALKNRQLIQSCFQNPHENLGRRILKRTAEKRKDFGKFYTGINSEQREDLEETIKTLLKKSVANMEFVDEVQRLAEEFGERFVQYRTLSFKADYFSTIADSTITECVYLDNAVHPAHLTLNAFSQFITTLFSSVRDGFYNEMRRLRRTSNSFSTGSNGSARRQKKSSVDSREVSPSCDKSGEDESSSRNSAGSSPDDSSHDSLYLHPRDAREASPTPVNNFSDVNNAQIEAKENEAPTPLIGQQMSVEEVTTKNQSEANNEDEKNQVPC